MGRYPRSEIVFGVPFEEEFEFPWNEDEDNDEGSWWSSVNGFEYKDHESYYLWLKSHPMPFEVIYAWSYEYGERILAVPGVHVSSDGVADLDLSKLVVPPGAEIALVNFMEKYEIEYEGVPRWLFTAFYG